jgi:hypothetical protein
VQLSADSPSSTQPTETRLAFARIDWAALLKRIYDVDALACRVAERGGRCQRLDDAGVRGVNNERVERLPFAGTRGRPKFFLDHFDQLGSLTKRILVWGGSV